MKKNCKNCHGQCDSCAQNQAKAFELEVDEEIQQERLTLFWKKYSWLIYTVVILILAFVVGFESYNTWRSKIRIKESDLFEKSVLLAHNDHAQKAIEGFELLSQDGKTGYQTLARLELANLWMISGENDKALNLLKTTIQDTNLKDPLHQVAILSFVGYQLDNGNPDELMEILKPVLDDDYFQGLATELAFILLKKQNKMDEAKKLVQTALLNPNSTPDTKTRLNNLLGE